MLHHTILLVDCKLNDLYMYLIGEREIGRLDEMFILLLYMYLSAGIPVYSYICRKALTWGNGNGRLSV